MNKKKMISTTSLFAVAAIAVFTISPYFYDVTVDEALPTASAKLPSGTFVGSGDGIHEAEGNVLSLKLEDGSQYVRFENFKSTNGPDLYVYLATDDQASDFVLFATPWTAACQAPLSLTILEFAQVYVH